ncbi:hypothetical protein [Megalodesulfovibrio gigas]|uniref:Uncharacterized protein n=1 Tax=Megalodesulfovibrio gigas (strain ATCC 19364 / DSM 1382 / NCIMB 9332 / VKM B-1759) TaxID=1121448 RepID=T2G7Y2_MEGG1|nr:hypothetical protein [Megalodesulfovibrio gigas]AGW12398.1 hypothetical protein DGI_0487 [Megalodesulfovibrio gigas DSM 1382 = ATCC 19364]
MQHREEKQERDRLLAAARMVDRQASADPAMGVPVDPDVADCMGAFVEDAVALEDLDDSDEVMSEEGGDHGES